MAREYFLELRDDRYVLSPIRLHLCDIANLAVIVCTHIAPRRSGVTFGRPRSPFARDAVRSDGPLSAGDHPEQKIIVRHLCTEAASATHGRAFGRGSDALGCG